jgi:flagellar motor switch protein FliN/FliY
MTQSGNDLLRALGARWSELLVQILQSMTDEMPKAHSTEAGPPQAVADAFWWEQRLSLGETFAIRVSAPSQTWTELGARTLRAAGIEKVEEGDAKNTYLEILSQSLSGLAQSIGTQLGLEVTCSEGMPCEPPTDGGHWVSVEIAYGDVALPAILLGFSTPLLERLQHESEAALEREEAAGRALECVGPPPAVAEDSLPRNSKTLKLLLDVELPVSVSFGRAELMLKDVLKLTTGSIVELNRGVNEPVEVIVNNCVVARGEVVVMEGNYGVRIQQIISPQERLRTLR